MTNPEQPKQPPTPEQARAAEQEPKNDTGDLALLAEFQAEKLSKAIKTATDPTIRDRRQRDADVMAGAHRRIADLVSTGHKTPQEAIEAFDKLEQGWDAERMDLSVERTTEEEEEIDKALAEIRRARALIEQNQNADFYSRKDFSDWLKERNARLREARQKEDQRREKEEATKKARQIDEIRERLGVGEQQAEQVKGLSVDEIDTRLSGQNIRTVEDIKRVVTPEVKAGILDHILKAVDARIEQGKRIASKEKGVAVEARSMAIVLGQEAVGRRYQFVASASEGKIINATEIGKMRIDEFLKKFLDYDLRSDQSRRADLEKYTNMID